MDFIEILLEERIGGAQKKKRVVTKITHQWLEEMCYISTTAHQHSQAISGTKWGPEGSPEWATSAERMEWDIHVFYK